MKTMLTIVALVLMLCGMSMGQEKTQGMTVWGMYDTSTAGVRVGYFSGANEVGLFGAWRPDPDVPPNIFGVYGLHNFAAIEVPNPVPISWLPEKISAVPYLGGYITVDFADEQRKTLGGPMAGLKLMDILALEYRYQLVNGPLEASFDNGQSVFAICVPVRF